MDQIKSKRIREILHLIERFDSDPNADRPTTFWFYSDKEENIYRLAHHLQELSLKIDLCENAKNSGYKYLLIAEKCMSPTIDKMDNLWTYFTEIAERYSVTFDGWETRIEL